MTDVANALDGARLVRVIDGPDGLAPLAAVWYGGTTVNVYSTASWTETTCFSLSDEKGEPVDRETMDEHITDWFESERDER